MSLGSGMLIGDSIYMGQFIFGLGTIKLQEPNQKASLFPMIKSGPSHKTSGSPLDSSLLH